MNIDMEEKIRKFKCSKCNSGIVIWTDKPSPYGNHDGSIRMHHISACDECGEQHHIFATKRMEEVTLPKEENEVSKNC